MRGRQFTGLILPERICGIVEGKRNGVEPVLAESFDERGSHRGCPALLVAVPFMAVSLSKLQTL